MAGVIARKLIGRLGIDVFAHTVEIGGIKARAWELTEIKESARNNPLWCADREAADKMARLIEKAREEKDSLGGVIEGIALNVPVGLGEPVFDNLDGELSKALFAIPAVKGVEFGAGFAVADMKGSENNDLYDIRDGKIVTRTNNAGGVLGGISTGMPVLVRVAVKPTASIARSQETVDIQKMAETNLTVTGRHDTCIVPRAVPGVEAMMVVTICDFALRAGLITRVLT
jgi:chorismate synthase